LKTEHNLGLKIMLWLSALRAPHKLKRKKQKKKKALPTGRK